MNGVGIVSGKNIDNFTERNPDAANNQIQQKQECSANQQGNKKPVCFF